MTTLSETLRHLSPPDRVRAQIARLADSDAVTVDKADLLAILGSPVVSDTDQRAHDQAAADMAHRDDLARDIAQMWGPAVSLVDAATGTIRKDWPGLAAALDRLAAAYGETP